MPDESAPAPSAAPPVIIAEAPPPTAPAPAELAATTSDSASSAGPSSANSAPLASSGTSEDVPFDYKVQLEHFFGPLDLLLHLVKENEVDVLNIPVASVADQYVQYVEALQKLDIDMAGEFLKMASTLLLMKSRTLMPAEAPEGAEEEEDEGDPRLDLIRKLIEFKRFKDRAHILGERMELWSLRAPRPPLPVAEETTEEPLVALNTWELVSRWARIAGSVRLDVPLSILYSNIPVEEMIKTLAARLAAVRKAKFTELIENREDKGKVIVTLMALLEMTKDQLIRIHQPDGEVAEIYVTHRDNAEDPVVEPSAHYGAGAGGAEGAETSLEPEVKPSELAENILAPEGSEEDEEAKETSAVDAIHIPVTQISQITTDSTDTDDAKVQPGATPETPKPDDARPGIPDVPA